MCCVEHGDPSCSTWVSPVEQHEEDPRRVVDVGISCVGEEDGFQRAVLGKGEQILGLVGCVSAEVLELVG